MHDLSDIAYIAVVCMVLICIVGFYLWLWRGQFISGSHTGFRLEEHRRKLLFAIRLSLPAFAFLVLSAAGRSLNLYQLSHVQLAFWSGILVASYFWLTALAIFNTIAAVRHFLAERVESPRLKPMLRD